MEKEKKLPFQNPELSFEERADDLIARLGLEEKVSQMTHFSPAIQRLGIPAYTWWNECLHGVARAGVATVFPQAIGLAAAWNAPLIQKVADAISEEARAKHHEAARRGDRGIYKGINFWSPNINIFRDPRWGRGQETYGEDPFLAGRIGAAFVKGLQGEHPRYLKCAATPKHFAVHSGPELLRHKFNAVVSQQDLRETYLPAFRECVVEAKAESVMGAYNRTNGEPCCASPTLLIQILRKEWGFKGHVVSDCDAICDIHANHKVADTRQESAALAVKNGCDLNCGETYSSLLDAIREGLITEKEIDAALKNILLTRFRLGLLDPPDIVPYSAVPFEKCDCEEHRDLARQAARESIVLLKNYRNLLPLSKNLKTIAVIGPNADDRGVLLGNYNGTPSQSVTVLEGIRRKLPDARIFYAPGCPLEELSERGHVGTFTRGFAEALACAERAEAVIMVLGLNSFFEGEEGDGSLSPAGGDRVNLNLPGKQQELLEAVCATGTPVVLALMSGSALAVNWAQERVPAILQAWYPGEEGGTAVADAIFGDYNPAGRLPITFYKSLDQLPPFEDYAMNGEKGRTYRYMKEEPLYPFGFGLSYTRFEYSSLRLSAKKLRAGEPLEISANVKNIGSRAGDEVAQLYLSYPKEIAYAPLRQLRGFMRFHLNPGESRRIAFTLAPEQMSLFDREGKIALAFGEYQIFVGGSQPDERSAALGGANVLAEPFYIVP